MTYFQIFVELSKAFLLDHRKWLGIQSNNLSNSSVSALCLNRKCLKLEHDMCCHEEIVGTKV